MMYIYERDRYKHLEKVSNFWSECWLVEEKLSSNVRRNGVANFLIPCFLMKFVVSDMTKNKCGNSLCSSLFISQFIMYNPIDK